MARQNKNKSVQNEVKKNIEVSMSEETTLDNLQTEIDLARAELENTKLEIEEKKKELEFAANRAIDEEEKRIIDRQISNTNERKAVDSIIEKQKAYDNVPVTGKFMNLRNPGQSKKLPYHKYVDDPVKWWDFEHNKVYTIPRGFCDQINEYYHRPHFIQKQGPMDPNAPTTQIADIDTSEKLYAFVPVNF